jgi:hypothetical protein
MGYESRIYVMHKYDFRDYETGKRCAEKIAMIDMCKVYDLSDILRNKPETDCHVYTDDGNGYIEKDCYNKPLTETPLHEALHIVKDVIAKTPYKYWRYYALLATLQSIYDFVGDDENYVVLHYGY